MIAQGINPASAFARQHPYRTRLNAFAGYHHIFQMALFFTAAGPAAIGTDGLAVILYGLNMPTVTLRLTELFAVVLDVVGF